jgi:hypothetical protein
MGENRVIFAKQNKKHRPVGVTRKCVVCGEDFEVRRWGKKYCRKPECEMKYLKTGEPKPALKISIKPLKGQHRDPEKQKMKLKRREAKELLKRMRRNQKKSKGGGL